MQAPMKNPAMRVVMGIIGAVVVVLGVRQMMSGFREMSGKSPATQPQKIGERKDVPAHGCSLKVPEGWETKDASQGGVMFVAPKSSGYAVNFIVMSQPF